MRQDAYPIVRPEEVGVSAEAVRATIRDIRETNELELHSFLMLRRGALVWEEYFREHERERLHVLHSVSKSFTSTAIGLAVDEGMLQLSNKLYDFFPEYGGLCDSDLKRRVTLEHMLMMGSGFENNEGVILASQWDSALIEQALAQPVIHEPGTHFNYYTLGTYLVSAAFSRVCRMGVHRYLRRRLFDPLGIGESQWNVDGNDIPMGGLGLYLSAYDMTRLGQLYLQDGMWEGQRILSPQYAAAATSQQIDNSDSLNDNPNWTSGYGYQFWRNSFSGYRADGMKGQYILVFPEYDTVVVMTSQLENMGIPLAAVETILLPGIECA